MANTVIFTSFITSLFKVIEGKYFSQGKWEFMKFLFALLVMIKILTL
jgi:hypothetical protein